MPNSILKDLLKEYEQKRLQAEKDMEIRKSELYAQNPKLEKIENDLNSVGIECAKAILFSSSDDCLSQLQNKLSYLKKEKEKILTSLGKDDSYLKPIYECSICNDTGYITYNYSTVMCNCLKQKLLDISYNKSNISNLDKENFDYFNINLYSNEINKEKYNSNISPRENITIIKKIVDNFILHFDSPEEKNLLLTGNTGLGKTFLSNCIAKEIMNKGKIVLYQTAPVMLDTILDYRFGKNAISKDFYDSLLNSDLLIIDDLGTESMNSLKFTELFNIINSRLLNTNNKVTKTIISTNLNLQNLFSHYDERIVSRIVGYYNICKFFGDDIRFKKTK